MRIRIASDLDTWTFTCVPNAAVSASFSAQTKRKGRFVSMTGKSPLTSKTLWVNFLALIGSAVMYFSGTVTPEQWAAATGAALPVINIVLRLVTNEPIDWSGEEK